MKKIVALILAVVCTFSAMTVSAFAVAEETAETVVVTVGDTQFIFDKNTTEEFRNSFIEDYTNPGSDDGAATYGLMCTLFGHKYESTVITTITHKARATNPRCLRNTYNREVCSRCDHTQDTLLESIYITCC